MFTCALFSDDNGCYCPEVLYLQMERGLMKSSVAVRTDINLQSSTKMRFALSGPQVYEIAVYAGALARFQVEISRES